MCKNNFLEQTTFYKSFFSGLVVDIRILFRFFFFVLFVSMLMEVISYYSLNTGGDYSFVFNVVKSFVDLPVIFLSFLFYKFYTTKNIEYKMFFRFETLMHFYISSLIYCFVLLFLLIVSFMFFSFTDLGLLKISNDIVSDLDKLFLSLTIADYIAISIISFVSTLLILMFIFVFYSTTANSRLNDLSFFQSIKLSIKQVFKNTLFLLMPLILFLLMIFGFSYITDLNYIDINIKTYILKPMFTVIASYYLFNLYLMVFKKGVNIRYLK